MFNGKENQDNYFYKYHYIKRQPIGCRKILAWLVVTLNFVHFFFARNPFSALCVYQCKPTVEIRLSKIFEMKFRMDTL